MEGSARQLVFLHSMWRARSTWLFGLFRETGRFHCYYEPLNESLVALDANAIATGGRAREDLRHSPLAGGYWQEYRGLLSESGVGVEGFDERFAFHPFDRANEPRAYFDRLVERSPRSPVLFKMCRSPYRIAWFTGRYRDARHYYLERDSRSQFESYGVEPGYFLPMQLLSAWLQPALRGAIRRRFPELCPSFVGRMRWTARADETGRLRRFFRRRLDDSGDAGRRAVFEFLHAAARREARAAGATIVDVDDPDAIEAAFGPFGLRFPETGRATMSPLSS